VFIAVAIHYAAPEYVDDFIEFMHKVIDATTGAPGLLEFTACRDPQGRYLAGYSRWTSAEAFQDALPTIGSLAPLRRPEWSIRPDELITLVEA